MLEGLQVFGQRHVEQDAVHGGILVLGLDFADDLLLGDSVVQYPLRSAHVEVLDLLPGPPAVEGPLEVAVDVDGAQLGLADEPVLLPELLGSRAREYQFDGIELFVEEREVLGSQPLAVDHFPDFALHARL